MLDPLIQLGYIDAFIVSKAEVGHYPVLGRGAKETGIILVERENHHSRRSALEAIESKLTAGYSVLIYPEGTTHGGELTGDFKRGAFELVQKLNIPVIPVMIEYPGPEYYWVDGPLLGYFKRIFSSGRKHLVSGKIGTSIDPKLEHQLLEKTKSQINAMIRERRALVQK
jgi:1-acyl-sn-glycerol-3-phosphate acyltransferase